MKIKILFVCLALSVMSYGQKTRVYKDADVWWREEDNSTAIGNLPLKIVWERDKDCTENIKKIYFPNNIVASITTTPTFEGSRDGYKFYYFGCMTSDGIYTNGSIMDFNDVFCVSVIVDGKSLCAYFEKRKFTYLKLKK